MFGGEGEVVGFPDGHGVGLGWREPCCDVDKASGLSLLAGWFGHFLFLSQAARDRRLASVSMSSVLICLLVMMAQ